MTVRFKLDGVELTALNGGPVYQFNGASPSW
jgi:predicted 3-demethylubiquinone-9 3-methyltransferase (glyoxalase superfamily)